MFLLLKYPRFAYINFGNIFGFSMKILVGSEGLSSDWIPLEVATKRRNKDLLTTIKTSESFCILHGRSMTEAW